MIVMKTIKPARFRDEAFAQGIKKLADDTAKDIEKDFKKTVASWSNKPEFEKLVDVSVSPVQILVATDDPVYGWVSGGTGKWGPKGRSYPIFAGIYTGKSNKKALHFQWGGPGSYRAKTQPNVIGSGGGGPSGPFVTFPYVEHPGIKPRNFDKVIAEKWEPRFKRRAEAMLSTATKRSGHKYTGGR